MAMLANDWAAALKAEFAKPYYRELYTRVRTAYSKEVVYPPSDEIFQAYHLTALSEVRVVILGQDPYHEEGQAHGLCFSVKENVAVPPSLVNIYKELHDDIGFEIPKHGCLEKWAKQGVLLLNTVLTVRAHAANSHKGFGWEQFTDATLRILNEQDRPIVYLLWGRNARDKKAMLNNPQQLVLEAAHPSPLSAYNGFFGCKHFSKTNEFLRDNNIEPIDWQI